MMGQMIRQERVIPQMGYDGSHAMMVMHPLDLQGEFNVNIDVSDESVIKQERVSEAMAFVNMIAPIAPMANINMQAVVKRVLEAQGVTDADKYFNNPASQPQQGMMAPPQGTPPGTPGQGPPPQLAPPGAGSQGQTNSALATQMGGNNGMNLSPDQFAQSQVQAAQQLG